MTLPQNINQLAEAFAKAEANANQLSETEFFKRPANGKWSAAENIQHLFFSVKPLVGLFGKPEMMVQLGKPSRTGMSYDEVVQFYKEKLKTFATANIVNKVDGLSATQAEQLANLNAINTKFLERAAILPDDVLDGYQIPHPLLVMLSVREFLYFTHYHTLHHTQTIADLAGGKASAI